YLANAHDFLTTIAFIHAITGPAALRSTLPYLDAEATQESLIFMWQASAGLYATFGTARAAANFEPQAFDRDELIDRAIATGDEHAIKSTEACLSDHALNRRQESVAAADHAIEVLGGLRK